MPSSPVRPRRPLLLFAFGLAVATACRSKPSEPRESPKRTTSSPKAAKGGAGRTSDEVPRQKSRPGVALLPALEGTSQQLVSRFDAIPAGRRKQLEGLGLFIRARLSTGDPAEVLFFCPTRPQLSQQAQAWSAAASAYFGLRGVQFRAVGLPSARTPEDEGISHLERSGFQRVGHPSESRLLFSPHIQALDLRIQRPDDPELPQSEFATVAICSAPESTPTPTRSAALAVSLPYDESDGDPEGTRTSSAGRETNDRIGTEMFYLASLVARTRTRTR